MKQLITKITENQKIADKFYRMRLESAYLAKKSEPGQFVEVKVCDEAEPLLRRPLGVHRISKTGIELLYEVVGKGTEILSRRKAGELLDVIGPLGTGFDIKHTKHDSGRMTIMVAGGVGVAPLLALAESLVNSKRLTVHRKNIYILIGACKKTHLLCEKNFSKLGVRVMVATEDGSKGHKGLITDVLSGLLSTVNRQPSTIYACGPVGMLKAVAKLAHDERIPCQVSLEERMACGVGVCLGCPVKVKPLPFRDSSFPGQFPSRKGNGYKMVCKDGPVFNAEEIVW